MYNQNDLSKIYGVPISMPQALPGGTLPDTLTDRIPSLEEFAGLNPSQNSQNIIDVPHILNNPPAQNNMWQASTSNSNITNLRPAPQRPDLIPIYDDVIQSNLTPSGGAGSQTNEGIEYLNGLIRTQIGRRASIDFLLGTSGMVTKDGYILGVGSNYILINEIDTDDITACDFYNIKFIRFFY